MSSVFSKNKGKRSRSSSGESNNSFVKNVTSRVSGLLPATITKWFSSPRSSSNGSAGGADATDSSTDDEGTESPVQPPNKRMRREERSFGSADASCVTNNIETLESSTQYTVQSPPGRTTFRRETNFVSTPIIRPDEAAVDRTADRTDKDSTATFTQNKTAASIGLSASRKRKSLFGDKTQELSDATQKAYAKTSSNTLRDPRQPTFKPTLLGSPFYAGKTTYGGAASSYINQPNISQRQNTIVKEAPSTSDNTMSTSARRILELLESYSSPLMDAKRIPHYTRPTRQEVLKRHSETSSLGLLSPYNKTNSYKAQELHVPSIASILRLKQRSRLDDCTNAARQLVASHSSSSPDYLPYPTAARNRDQSEVDGNSKFTTKVKTKRTRIHGSDANALETETVTPVELPKAVLQIDPNNLPNFSIPVASKSSSIEKPTLTTPFATSTFASKTTSVEKRKSETTTSNSKYCKYNFANPVRITSESPKPTSTPPKFTFGSPERSIDKPLVSENTSEPSIILGASKESEKKTEAAAADWNCPDCWVKNKSDAASCVCCGHKHRAAAAASPAKCSLCKLANSQPNSDKCVNCAKVQVNNIAKPLKADTTAKWSCKDCWASNDDASDKCACCGAVNPKKQATQTVPAVEKSGVMCSKCFSTKNSDGTCSKCAESKPDNTFKVVLKSQANKWECEHCLVRNDSDKTKCVCCEAERSGAPKQPEKKQFNFGTVNTTFKFGIDPKVQEANLAKMSAETKDKAEESETNNNVLAKAPPTFSFGIPAKKPEDQPDAPKVAEKAAETPKATFTFGVPKHNSIAPTGTPAPMFGITNKLTEVSKESEKKDKPEEKEKPVLNNKPEEAKKADEPAKPPVMMFGSAPLADKSTTNQLLSTAFTLKKDAPSASLSLATTSTPAPILTFSAPTTGSAEKIGLFGAAATSAPATTMSFAPTTTASASSALSMFQKTDEKPINTIFQKSDPSTTAPTSIFPKSDAPAASAAAPAPAAAPMFSFGSSQAQSGEKPSFSFTFGSNKSDVFKPPTFAAKDSSTAANKFSLGGSSTENPLAPNPVAGGNGPSATNSLTGSSLGGNGLSVNPLAVGLSPGNAPSIFGSAIQKENSWAPPNNSAANPFNANASTNSAPKPFSFGSSTPFSGTPAPAFGTNNTQTTTPAFGSNLATSPPAFGSAAQPAAAPAFGASQTAATPAFGSIVQSTPNIFGMPSQNSQPSIFSTPNQNSTGMFGSPTQPAQAPALGMFGRPSVGATPTFGTPNPSLPTFEAPSVPAPAPSFNFGTPQTSSFMFGQQPQQQAQQPQTGVYNFGAAGGQAAQVQFSMGSAPSAGMRRVRRGLRRTSQR
ncbi:nuclear pore complex protein Nup153 [Cydia amplana]|uniref:nuclear pore complex protein Nup153 n=1 Tax=Cydia amplana TaxID=1869771 RepID=UPI002FE63442